MTRINHPCRAETDWAQEPLGSMHAYRVTCAACRKFIKWGTTPQLRESRTFGQVRHVVRYMAPATLDAFYV